MAHHELHKERTNELTSDKKEERKKGRTNQ